MSSHVKQKSIGIPETFSERLRQLIGDKSVNAAARELGLQQASVDRYVKGLHAPNAEAIYVVATHFGVSADWLLGISPTPKRDGGDVDMWKEVALSSKRKLDKVNEALGKIIEGTKALQEAVK